jgi:hypothetical protein
MPQSSYLQGREINRSAAEIRRECADAARRARSELAEARAAARKTIIESRDLMAEADAIMARR